MRHPNLLLPLLLLVAGPPSAGAAPAPLPLLHERLTETPAQPGAATSAAPHQQLLPPAAGLGGEPDDDLPSAILQDGVGLLPPPGDPRPSSEEQVHGVERPAGAATGPGSRPAPPGLQAGTAGRQDGARLDRQTGADDVLTYHEVFNPAVSPFKRDAAFDRVLPDESLGLSGTLADAARVTPRGPQLDPAFDAFWGSLVLEFAGAGAVPIPSVAPGAELLVYRTQPALPLSFWRDAADNFWVRAERPYFGRVRLNFLTAAPATAFGGPVPEFSLANVPVALRPRVPAAVQAHAARVLQAAAVRPGQTRPREALFRLVEYFRGFSPGEPPAASAEGSLYLDLALARRGVCRHRALAFVITAQAYGLPARYVHNEAHAFVEVYLPGPGWRRVDLGGAARELQVRNGLGKVPHQPRSADPFPRPTPYGQSYSAPPLAAGSDDGGSDDGGSRPGAEASEAGRDERGAGRPGPAAAAATPAAATQSATNPGSRAAGVEAPPAVFSVVLERTGERGHRGEPVEVAGRVEDPTGAPLGGQPVAIVLQRRIAGSTLVQLLGVLVSDAEGRFAGSVPVAPELPPGRYELQAVDGRPFQPRAR